MGTFKLILFLFVFFVFQQSVFAQSSSQKQIWSLNFLRVKVDKLWDLYVEAQPRFDLDDSSKSRFLFRPAAIYLLDDNETLWVGYLYAGDNQMRVKEHRLWQQYQRTDKVDEFVFLNRTRFEQRIDPYSQLDTTFRLRHLFRSQFFFEKNSSWSIVVFDEVFFDLSQGAFQKVEGFNQNRLFLGAKKDISTELFLEAGYLNQWLKNQNTTHAPFITMGLNL